MAKKIKLHDINGVQLLPTTIAEIVEFDNNVTVKQKILNMLNRHTLSFITSDEVSVKIYTKKDISDYSEETALREYTFQSGEIADIVVLDDEHFEVINTTSGISKVLSWPGIIIKWQDWFEDVLSWQNCVFRFGTEYLPMEKWQSTNSNAKLGVTEAQYKNCIFWDDLPMTNNINTGPRYVLHKTVECPLFYSTIRENTYSYVQEGYNISIDDNWNNEDFLYSFSNNTGTATGALAFAYRCQWALPSSTFMDPDVGTNVFTLPSNITGMFFSCGSEIIGTIDGKNVTDWKYSQNTDGSWQGPFVMCYNLRELRLKNLKASINLSWSPLSLKSLEYLVSNASNTSAINIKLSTYSYYILTDEIKSAATSKNITFVHDDTHSKQWNIYKDVEGIKNSYLSSDNLDLTSYVSKTELNAAGYITSFTETDPTVPSYVKSITEENISYWNDAEPSALWLDVEYNNNTEIYEIVQDIEFSYISDAWNEHRNIYITYEGTKYSCIYCGERGAEFNCLNGNDKWGVTIVNRTIIVEERKNGIFCSFNEYQLKENSATIKIIDFTQDGNTTYTLDGKTITYLTTVENFDEIQDYIAITKKADNNGETTDGVIYGKYNNTCIPLTVELDTDYTDASFAPPQGVILNYKNCILGHIINSRNYINEITWIKDTVVRGGKLGRLTITNTYTCIFSEYPNITSLDDYVTYTQANSYYQPIGNYLTEHQSLSSYVTSANYDSNTKKIYLKHGTTTLSEIDATDFIKDGMVDTAYVQGANLVISFNTDAGKEAVNVPIANIFNANNYYTKSEIDNAGYLTSFTESDPTVPTHVKSITQQNITDWNNKLSSETQLSKGTTTGSGNAVTDISVSNHQITLTKGSTFLTAHQDIKTINNQTITGTGNVTINELPTVSSSDNGKVLQVVNGQWQLVTPTTIYSGTGTPDNSQGNNGDLYMQI